jgi:hypothetical protein
MLIDGGFFWVADDNAPVIVDSDRYDRVTRCVFYYRPKWYQVLRWYRAWRYWLALPTHRADGPSQEQG